MTLLTELITSTFAGAITMSHLRCFRTVTSLIRDVSEAKLR